MEKATVASFIFISYFIMSFQVPRGTVKHVSALGTEFAVFRGNTSGKAFITDAYCPHLGANLACGGKVIDDCVQCPFHEWQFSGETGAIEAIPYAKKVFAY